MSPVVVAVVLAAAVCHATWNAMAHSVKDRLIGFALIGVASVLGGGLMVLVSPAPNRTSWVYVGVSATIHVGYNLFLMLSYRLGQFGQTYPLARGTSPWLVAILAAVFAGESLPLTRLGGVLLISGGLAMLVTAGGLPKRGDLPAIGAAVATGVMIASYTVVDGLGVRASGSSLGYTGWLFLLQGFAVPAVAFAIRGPEVVRQSRPFVTIGLLGGVISMVAYGLVLWAQTRAPLAPVAALRESSVVIGALIATVRFREPFGLSRLTAAVLVAAGITLIGI